MGNRKVAISSKILNILNILKIFVFMHFLLSMDGWPAMGRSSFF